MSPFSLQRGIMRPTQTCDVIPHNSSLRERATGESLADCNRPFSFSQTPTGSCGRVFGGASSRYFCKGALPFGETKLAPRFDVDAESAAVFSTGHACRGAKWLAIFFFLFFFEERGRPATGGTQKAVCEPHRARSTSSLPDPGMSTLVASGARIGTICLDSCPQYGSCTSGRRTVL